MSTSHFLEAMRAQANAGLIWKYLKWGALDALLAIFGIAILIAAGPGAVLIGGAMLIGSIIGGYLLLQKVRRVRSSPGYPVDSQLAAIGTLSQLSIEIDRDFAGEQFAARRVHVSRRWLCYAGKGQVTIRPLDQLTWAYTERIKHRLNAIIPYRPASYQLFLWDRNGRAAAIPVKKNDAQACLTLLQKQAPWIFVGYNDTLKESWNSDRTEFLALVEARRQTVRSQSSA